MPPCERPEGEPSKCHNKVKNYGTNRKVKCMVCKDHSENVKPARRRTSTQESRFVWQSQHNLNYILNQELEIRNARLQAKSDGINQTKKNLLDAVREMEIKRAKLQCWPNLSDAILLPSTSILLPEAPPRPPPTPSPPPPRRPTRKRKQVLYQVTPKSPKKMDKKCVCSVSKNTLASFIIW